MEEAVFFTLVSVLAASLISMVGLFTLSLKAEKLKKMLIYLISFSAGALLGDVFLHLIPELVEEGSFSGAAPFYLLGGVLLFFVLEKVIHWRHCHMPENGDHVHPFAYTNLVGDAFHNFLDGLIIASSYLVSIPVGIATTLAVLLHEIPQEIGDFGVLLHAGFSKRKALLLNFYSALAAVIGAGVGLLVSGAIEGFERIFVPIAAGGFVYIAGSDLIPELHKHSESLKRSLLQLLALVAGISVMALLLLLE
jgi:zinc and cadmium transporter